MLCFASRVGCFSSFMSYWSLVSTFVLSIFPPVREFFTDSILGQILLTKLTVFLPINPTTISIKIVHTNAINLLVLNDVFFLCNPFFFFNFLRPLLLFAVLVCVFPLLVFLFWVLVLVFLLCDSLLLVVVLCFFLVCVVFLPSLFVVLPVFFLVTEFTFLILLWFKLS